MIYNGKLILLPCLIPLLNVTGTHKLPLIFKSVRCHIKIGIILCTIQIRLSTHMYQNIVIISYNKLYGFNY